MSANERAHSFSFGITSAEGAWRDAQANGTGGMKLYFADTLCEDEDTYRFGIEAAALILRAGDVSDLAARARQLPTLEGGDLAARKSALRDLGGQAMHRIPGLVWLQDGRTIWEVARHHRWVNNSQSCKATVELKSRYVNALVPEEATLAFGMDWNEVQRMARLERRHPNRAVFPMAEPPYLDKDQMCEAWRGRGVEPPRMYAAGFPHGNCGGGCARAGKRVWMLLLRWNRDRYLWHEREELATQAHIGKPYTILKETVQGERRFLSLRELRERAEAGDTTAEQGDDWGACGCGIPEAA